MKIPRARHWYWAAQELRIDCWIPGMAALVAIFLLTCACANAPVEPEPVPDTPIVIEIDSAALEDIGLLETFEEAESQ